MINYKPYGDSGLLIEIGNEISEEINNKVLTFTNLIENELGSIIVETIPAYNSVLIIYDPLEIDYENLISKVKVLEENISDINKVQNRIILIPTTYGGEYGEDLKVVAEYNDLTEEEVIDIHSGTLYRVYMLGFTPGFPYLGGMSKKIETPRKKTPRKRIEKGSVGIGGKQTGIYSTNSPGGWQIIGRSPLELFDIKKSKSLINPGDFLKFES
ncbi:MAG: 5-oxoprolinase subunit PxpB, partial [Bacillota bacterium]|nr:5-oxoprolinase subunit PxpB [Bacillota bacterium]